MEINKNTLIQALKELDIIIHDIENYEDAPKVKADELCRIFNLLYLEYIHNGGKMDDLM